jgi:protein CpxP
MKKYTVLLLIFSCVIMLAKAQQKVPTATEMATKSVDTLAKRLKLNPTQKSVIYTYTLDLCKEQLALVKKQQAGNYNEDDVTKFYKMQNETTNRIKTLLKDDQPAEYDKFLEEQLNGGNKKKKNKRGKRNKEEEEVVTGISGLILPPNP